jgi:hypothetical protein
VPYVWKLEILVRPFVTFVSEHTGNEEINLKCILWITHSKFVVRPRFWKFNLEPRTEKRTPSAQNVVLMSDSVMSQHLLLCQI